MLQEELRANSLAKLAVSGEWRDTGGRDLESHFQSERELVFMQKVKVIQGAHNHR